MTTGLKHPDHLLPFYVNGSLDEVKTEEVEAHIKDCSRCQQEVQFLRKLREQVKVTTPERSPGKFGLNRLLKDIKPKKPKKQSVGWLKPAMAAAALVIVVQAGMLYQNYSSDTRYHQLGNASRGVEVIFKPQASEVKIRNALRSIDARIVDGPSALGLYHIVLPVKGDSEKDKQQREVLIKKLRAHSDVIQEISQ